MPKRLKISVREKLLSDGKTASLYLDFNRQVWNESLQKNDRYKFLELYVYTKPKTKIEREHNNFVYEQADVKKLEVYKEIISGEYGSRGGGAAKALDVDFLVFFKELGSKKSSDATRNHWENAYKHFFKFKDVCLMRHLTPRLLHEFKDFLDNQTVKHKTIKLAQNTKRSYFSIVLTAASEAYKRDYLADDVSKKVDKFRLKKSKRQFLSEEEIAVLRKSPFPESPVLTRAAFFSILTSLRWDDIRHLTYEQVRHSKKAGWHIDFEIKKTDRPDILYIGNEAFKLLDYDKDKTGEIFPMRYREKDKVAVWFSSAGIFKDKGGFHIFRHTFAVRMLNKGVALETIKELMGHASVKTTEHYAQMLGLTKKTAADQISFD